MTRPAAIYARVSSDWQKENHTISSQLAALVEYAGSHGYLVPPEWRFQDEGYSGAPLYYGPVWKPYATWRRQGISRQPWSTRPTG